MLRINSNFFAFSFDEKYLKKVKTKKKIYEDIYT